MRCKKHVADLSSTIGVCASCLRDRLFVIVAAQAQEERRRRTENSNTHPLVFSRSVSPFVSSRKSEGSNFDTWYHHQLLQQEQGIHDQRFFSTPHVGPNGKIVAGVSVKKGSLGVSFFANLLNFKSDKLDPDVSDWNPGRGDLDLCTTSRTWFASMLLGRRRKKTRTSSVEEPARGGQKMVCRKGEKGMSPARHSGEEDDHGTHELSGSLSDCSKQWKETPKRTPGRSAPGKRGGHNRNGSGFGFCLSPLVRASPSGHMNHKGIPPEKVVYGDMRVVPVKPSPSHPAAFCKNRSRKMADFGRCHLNNR